MEAQVSSPDSNCAASEPATSSASINVQSVGQSNLLAGPDNLMFDEELFILAFEENLWTAPEPHEEDSALWQDENWSHLSPLNHHHHSYATVTQPKAGEHASASSMTEPSEHQHVHQMQASFNAWNFAHNQNEATNRLTSKNGRENSTATWSEPQWPQSYVFQ